MGSNTLRVVEIDCVTKERVREYEKAVKTAENLYSTRLISKGAQSRILSALEEADKIFDFKNRRVFAVTTEAMRLAKNAKNVLKSIKDRFGIEFKIIDGELEAELTKVGVLNALSRLGFELKSYVLFDLGGGSLELSFVNGSKSRTKSFPIGILKMTQKYDSLVDIERKITEELRVLDEFIDGQSANFLVTTAGTPTTVCAFLQGMDYESYDYRKINGKKLSTEDFDKAMKKLLEMKKEQREFWVGTNRGDVVCVGIVIVKSVMKKLGYSTCIVCDDGLREGLAITNL